MLPSSTGNGRTWPAPWPVPPRFKSLVAENIEDGPNENPMRPQELCNHHSRSMRSNGKVSPAVFRRIYELFPEHIDDVLREDQIPTLRLPAPRISTGSTATCDPLDNFVENDDPVPDSRKKGVSCSEQLSQNNNKASDDEIEHQRTEGDQHSGNEVSRSSNDNLNQNGEAFSEKIQLVTSLGDLFGEDSDYFTPKTSLRADGESYKALLPRSVEKSNSRTNGCVAEDAKHVSPRSQTCLAQDSTSPCGAASNHVNSKETRAYVGNMASTVDDEKETHKESEEEVFQRGSSSGSIKSQTNFPLGKGHAKPALRRPIASRRKGVVDFSPHNQHKLDSSESRGWPERIVSPKEIRSVPLVDVAQENMQESAKPVSETPKGVIMRSLSHYKQVRGIRRAESGLIMSRDELNSTPNRTILENPVPKSLRPPVYLADYEDVPSLSPSSFQKTMKESSVSKSAEKKPDDETRAIQLRNLFPLSPVKPDEAPGSSSKLRKLFSQTPTKPDEGKRNGGRSPFSITPVKHSGGKRSDGRRSLFSLSPANHSKVSGGEFRSQENNNSSKFSDGGDSSGLIGRLGFGLKRATHALGRKSFPDVSEGEKTCTLVIPGSGDEAVCRICVICRNNLNCVVVVKDGGRKIKVQSRNESRTEEFRATLLIREIPGPELRCSINIRSSRSDKVKTSSEALWNFCQRLDQELLAGA